MPALVIKRDGSQTEFKEENIAIALLKALEATGERDPAKAWLLAGNVVQELGNEVEPIDVERIQDLCEKVLMQSEPEAAKAFILYREERAMIREAQKQLLGGKTTKLPLSLNALKVLAKRYLQKDDSGKVIETPEEMFHRVAWNLAKVEANYGANDFQVAALYQDFYSMMANFEFTPAGRTLTNTGASTALVANCIVLHIEDSMEGIFQTLKDAAQLQQLGSGLGFPFHSLRPAGTIAKKSKGVASGPVSFLRAYDNAFGTIKQNSRNGANLSSFLVEHPDILEFIHCKNKEGEINNFNISVAFTDEFMNKVVTADPNNYYCQFNGIKQLPQRIKRDHRGAFESSFQEQMTASQLFNEIIDSAWLNGEPGCLFIDTANNTNPLPGLGRLNATNPCITGESLIETVEGKIPIKELVGREIDVYCMENEKLSIKKATNIRMTEKNAKTIQVETLNGSIQTTPDHKVYVRGQGWKAAKDLKLRDIIVGLQRNKKSEKYLKVKLNTEKEYTPEHRFVCSFYQDINDKDVHHINGNTFDNSKNNLEAISHSLHSQLTNIGHENWCEQDGKGYFLKKEMKKKKQSIYWDNPQKNGFTVIKVSKSKDADVYNMVVDKVHNYIANGFVVANCGEQYLHNGDVCNLGSINLEKFVINGQVDWPKLGKVTRDAVMLMDNVIDLTKYPVELVEKTSKSTRRIGLGIMGWGDMLYQLHVAYDSQDGVNLAEMVMSYINSVAHKTSQEMAKKKGNFPAYELSIYTGKKIPMRNAALTTVAPTGTISMMFDTSSGIEPCFALTYFKGQVMGNNILYYTNKHFEKELKERGLYSDELMAKIAEHGSCQGINEIPEDMQKVYVTAHDISPEWHIRMQAAFQKHVDNSISKTINFPHDATKEEVKQAYILAWQLGLKGMTVYRDGSRKIEVLSVKDPSKKEEKPAPLNNQIKNNKEQCPSCKTNMRVEEGCANCPNCGNSLCKI